MIGRLYAFRISTRLSVAVFGLLFLSAVTAAQPPVASPSSVTETGPKGIPAVRSSLVGGIPGPHAVRTQKLDSKLMGREMPYRILLPEDYDKSTERYPVVYLLHGLTGHFDNWTDKTELAKYLAGSRMIVITPEGENGWYTDSVTKPSDKYESYIINELVPEIDKSYRTIAKREQRAIAGLSMGGFGAIKFGLKYPLMFSLAGSFSGALGAATITEKTVPGAIGKSIDAIFGPPDMSVRRTDDPFAIIRNASPDDIKKFPFLYVDCGTEDFLFKNNREFVELLLDKDVPHEYRQLPGAHNWQYWDKQVLEFIQVASTRLLPKK